MIYTHETGEKQIKELKKQSERDSNFELLRIIAMLMVILVHYAGHGGGRLVDLPQGVVYSTELYFTGWFQKTQAMVLNAGGQIGVNVFILISGYYLCKTTFKFERLLKTLAQVFFYSVAMAYLLSAFGIADISDVPWYRIFLPVMTDQYWFATAYVLLYLISPFLNIVVNNATQKQFLWLLGVLIAMSSVVPTLLNSSTPFYMWFVVLYFVAAYIRTYDLPFLKKPLGAVLAYIAAFLGICAASVWRHMRFDGNVETKDAIVDYMTQGHKLWIFAASVLLFVAFKNMKIKKSCLINTLASASFGVYLIHDNKYLREYLWTSIIKTDRYFYNNLYILYALAAAVLIYIACAVIDLIRQWALEKPLFGLYRSLEKKIAEKRSEK